MRYDRSVENVPAGLRAAEKAYKKTASLPNGSPDAARSLANWSRLNHWRRLETAHQHGWHWWHRRDGDALVCTCGLITSGADPDLPRPEDVAGHRSRPDGKPTTVLVVAVGRSKAGGYAAVCQTCDWYSGMLRLPAAAAAARSHTALASVDTAQPGRST